MVAVVDAYEEARLNAMREFDIFIKNDAIQQSLNVTLSNKSQPTNYVAWADGCRQFDDDHHEIYEAMFGT